MSRPTASTITDDQLDALYARLDEYRAMTDQTPQDAACGPQSTPDDSRAAEGATEAGDGHVAFLPTAAAADHEALENAELPLPPAVTGAPPVQAPAVHELIAELERLREQQAGHLRQMAGVREQARHRWQRMQQAERAIERVQALATQWETALPGQPHHGFAEVLRAALEGQQ